MKKLFGILALVCLLAGCNVSRRLVGQYVLFINGVAQGSLELKDDHTYVQTLRFKDQPVQTRMGRWSYGDTPPAGRPNGYGRFLYLEGAAALEGCPKCKVVPQQLVRYEVLAGIMTFLLVEDTNSGFAYAKQ